MGDRANVITLTDEDREFLEAQARARTIQADGVHCFSQIDNGIAMGIAS